MKMDTCVKPMVTRRTFLKLTTRSALAAATAPLLFAAGRAPAARPGGYAMPLEADRHARTFMQWPARSTIYGGKGGLSAVQAKIALIAKTVAGFEPVVMLATPDQIAGARAATGREVAFWPVPTEDLWCRDSGPTFVRTAMGTLAIAEIRFNGWGNRQGHTLDGRIARRVASALGIEVRASGLTGEGGGVEVDGAGTALAHESSWVNPNRNPFGRAVIEARLLSALGASHMIWAPGFRGADITDYHIDSLARFVKPGLIALQLPKSRRGRDPFSIAAYETYDILKKARDAGGRRLEIVVLPEPVRPRTRTPGFVASYANYYACNGAVICAEFGDDAADGKAQETLKMLFPGRQVVMLDVDPICAAGGGVHCTTQQQPAGRT